MVIAAVPPVFFSRRGPAPVWAEPTVVRLHGEQDIATKITIRRRIDRAAGRTAGPLFIDLSAVTFMDASTVGAIVDGRNRLRARGRRLEVRAPSPQARLVLKLCRLSHLIGGPVTTPPGPS